MKSLAYQNGQLAFDGLALTDIAARFGTPTYIYSQTTIAENFNAYTQALAGRDHLVCYAVKANSNLAVLNTIAKLGGGFDIVSQGELQRVLAAGGNPANVVFSGVAKTAEEMRFALQQGIKCFNLESPAELDRLNAVATEMGVVAPISVRVNPDVDAKTHPYISTGLKQNKFGINIEEAPAIYRRAATMDNIRVVGVDCHIGSQLTETAPFLDALDRLLVLIDALASEGITLHHLDLGGGLGVCYKNEQPPAIGDYIHALLEKLGDRSLTIMFEPGRSIVANAGALLTKVEFLKHGSEKNFAIIDAGMNDMIRPSLYQAWLDILPVKKRDTLCQSYDVVGPVCETGDFLGKDRDLAIEAGDLLAVAGSGAYGFSMSSNYNSRGRAAEIMVANGVAHQVRARETFDDLIRGETVLADA
ncbi:MAG TPA: diaminopimelate decarboxylase [Pseudomonadales bacterium]|nr:diaminopimelate decarboxylase [Pseudomonadales bacterium]